jgi:hypothetical protein
MQQENKKKPQDFHLAAIKYAHDSIASRQQRIEAVLFHLAVAVV